MRPPNHSSLLARLERTAYYAALEATDARREGHSHRAGQCETYVCLLEECASEIRALRRGIAEGVDVMLAGECLLEELAERRTGP